MSFITPYVRTANSNSNAPPPPPKPTPQAISFPAFAPTPPPKPATPAPAPSSEPSAPRPSGSKASKQGDTVWSQPKDTGKGQNQSTQVHYVVDYLKTHAGPIRREDLAIHSAIPIDIDQSLYEAVISHERVVVDPKTQLLSWRHDVNVANKQDVLVEVSKAARAGTGVSMKSLRAAWPDVKTAVEDLEKEGVVLVARVEGKNAPGASAEAEGGKGGKIQMVFYNELRAEDGGKAVDQEFKSLWHSIPVPADADILRSLESDGLQATAAENSVNASGPLKKKGKRSTARPRPVKITNKHLQGIDLTKDYVAPGKSAS